MANDNQQKLKKSLELLITAVSDEVKSPKNDLKAKIQAVLGQNPFSSSTQCRGYLLRAAEPFVNLGKVNLAQALHDLRGRLALIDAAQAAYDGNFSIVKTFVEAYPNLKNASGVFGTTLLYSSARNNHFDIVKYLIETADCLVNGENVEYITDQAAASPKATVGSTALHAACYNGRLDIVKYLIQHGGDYFAVNNIHETPIENAQYQKNVREFFCSFLLYSYSREIARAPTKTVLGEIRKMKELITDCFWEYKPVVANQWFSFGSDHAAQLQESLNEQQFNNNVPLSGTRDAHCVSLIRFVRFKRSDPDDGNFAWVRCRGSSLLNFHCYGQWQLMFNQHPTAVTNLSSLSQIFQTSSPDPIKLHSWYNFDEENNFLLETAVNYRRKYLNVTPDFLKKEKLVFDLENFAFTNQQNTITGFLRWIPRIIANDSKFTVLDNFQIPNNSDCLLLTTARTKTSKTTGDNAEMEPYKLKYERVFKNDEIDLPEKKSSSHDKDLGTLLHVTQDSLTQTDVDVIVVCTSSKALLGNVLKFLGKSAEETFLKKVQESKDELIISIPTNKKLPSKMVYFVQWQANPDPQINRDSIENLVAQVVQQANKDGFKSIAFPAIGCEEQGCSISTSAQILIDEVVRWVLKSPITVTFVILNRRMDIHEEFEKRINRYKKQGQISISVGKGTIFVEKGNLTKQNVDVIIGSSSSENLQRALFKAGGDEVETTYHKEDTGNPNSLIISTPPGNLPCKRVFFLRWEPASDPDELRQSIIDLIWNLIQNVNSHHFSSIAFPAIGCGEHACSVDVVVKTTVREMKKQILTRKLPWTVKFIIEPNQQTIYDEFCRHLLSSDDNKKPDGDFQVPSTWQKSKDHKIRFIVPPNSQEYKSIINDFLPPMTPYCKEIIRLERIQNERWYMQYLAHARDFQKRLNENTEKRLYHGCPEVAADAIIEDCFNRSFAGVNGTSYGYGVYFSSNVIYSHGYTRANANGERCMFVARVLVGKSTLGNSSMKTRPIGFDSTTDGNHMTVTYHDAQAYAEYLITYK
ncbi:unnamed protein product [Adineta ricciae]|uniref:Poly [ADP-ribose] polymerase n=1 Tax=Adineta ricciae TaxID=249248 RepID=A0A815GY46_ADIRI|nr:unnamed protein product [Adineta ricciae]CAF1346683.1 unnamed protein product [Adineta ricciae]